VICAIHKNFVMKVDTSIFSKCKKNLFLRKYNLLLKLRFQLPFNFNGQLIFVYRLKIELVRKNNQLHFQLRSY
jgi:hypothetical protein